MNWAGITAFVFDLDGVIVDSEAVMRSAYAGSCAHHGVLDAPPFESFARYLGMPLGEILAELKLPAEMAATYRAFSRASLHRLRTYPGVPEMLRVASRRFAMLGLITGKDRARTDEILEMFGLVPFFDAVVCGDDPFPGKPDPAGLRWIIHRFGVEPASVAVIGDSPIDIACCTAAGAVPLGAAWGFSCRADLAGAQRIFRSAEHLAGTLAGGARLPQERRS
jgi:HAD superfamily hydrolase (TIGR01509 family)